MSVKPNPEKVGSSVSVCDLALWTLSRVTSLAEGLNVQHLFCCSPYKRGLVYLNKKSKVAGVAKARVLGQQRPT